MKFFKIILIILLSIMFFTQISFAQNTDALKSEIYPKLRDRRCKMSLDKCNCPDAREMKAYIEALLETKVSKEEVFYKVAKKFSINTILDAQLKTDIEKRLIKEAGDKRPQVFVEPSTINFGTVSKKSGEIRAAFNLSNKGKADLIITNIKTSCGCVTISFAVSTEKQPTFGTVGAPPGWQMNIGPNRAVMLELSMDLNHRSVHLGHLLREFSIFSNDPIHPETAIIVEAEVSE